MRPIIEIILLVLLAVYFVSVGSLLPYLIAGASIALAIIILVDSHK